MERILRKQLKEGKFIDVSPTHSKKMGTVKGRGNKTTEVKFRLALVRAGISGWKMHAKTIPGNPDFYFPLEGIVIFLDGCFWHGCPKCGHIPKSNTGYWAMKFQRNIERDALRAEILVEEGYEVIRFWEHELKSDLECCVETVKIAIEK